MNHKNFFKSLDNNKNLHDLGNLIILTEKEYFMRTPRGNTKQNGKRGVFGEIDRGYINKAKNYAYVIEYKSTNYYKADKKCGIQCKKDSTMIHRKYGIPYSRIFMFKAYGRPRKDGYDIMRYK